jgi:hypothetical protein
MAIAARKGSGADGLTLLTPSSAAPKRKIRALSSLFSITNNPFGVRVSVWFREGPSGPFRHDHRYTWEHKGGLTLCLRSAVSQRQCPSAFLFLVICDRGPAVFRVETDVDCHILGPSPAIVPGGVVI